MRATLSSSRTIRTECIWRIASTLSFHAGRGGQISHFTQASSGMSVLELRGTLRCRACIYP
jgi:hypothetical protein